MAEPWIIRPKVFPIFVRTTFITPESWDLNATYLDSCRCGRRCLIVHHMAGHCTLVDKKCVLFLKWLQIFLTSTWQKLGSRVSWQRMRHHTKGRFVAWVDFKKLRFLFLGTLQTYSVYDINLENHLIYHYKFICPKVCTALTRMKSLTFSNIFPFFGGQFPKWGIKSLLRATW